MYEDRVAKGAALLDRVRPGWAAEINLTRLQMSLCDTCVLGQVYGNYYSGCVDLFLSRDDFKASAKHGFYLLNGEPSGRSDYKYLADAWRAAIRERVGTAATEGAVAHAHA